MVVFGHDSGPNTKNEDKDWARHLVENRVAVFRFDKRGVGDSDGVYRRGFVDPELLSGDLVAAVDFLTRDIRVEQTRIGLMGSSRAGWIIPIAATRSEYVAFTIILSGPAVTNRRHNFGMRTPTTRASRSQSSRPCSPSSNYRTATSTSGRSSKK